MPVNNKLPLQQFALILTHIALSVHVFLHGRPAQVVMRLRWVRFNFTAKRCREQAVSCA